MSETVDRFWFWWERYPGRWWFEFIGWFVHLGWILNDMLRSRIGVLRELDAFRELTELESKLAKWPKAVPLLERAIVLYGLTHQDEKRDEMKKRLGGRGTDPCDTV